MFFVACSIPLFEIQKKSTDYADEDEIMKIMMDVDNSPDENSKLNEVYDEVQDPEWSDNGEDIVEEDSVESNSRRNVR